MKAIKKILLNIHPDFTDVDTIDNIAVFASETQPAIDVLHVIDGYPQDLHEWWNVRHPIELYEAIITKRQARMDDVVDRIKAAGVEHVEAKLRWGSELHEVTREVAENNYELVITATQSNRGVSVGVLDCLCAGLCRQCPSSFWVTISHSQLPAQRILVVLDLENGTVRCESLNTKILRTAGWVAVACGSERHVAHTFSPSEIEGAEARYTSADRDSCIEEMRSEIQQACNSVLDKSSQSLSAEHIHLLRRASKTIIPKHVQQQGMSLILMGVRARSGLAGLLKGNTLEKIVDDVDCGVLIVEPYKFISPLLLDEEGTQHHG